MEIAKYRDELYALGWKLLTSEPRIVSRIGRKDNLHAYATDLGLLEHLPRHYPTPREAVYPCMLKAVVGDFGKGIYIVESEAQVAEKATGGFGCGKWLLQELCAGSIEYATSLLVQDGEILDAITTSYTYNKEVFVWPFVEEVRCQHEQPSSKLLSVEPLSSASRPVAIARTHPAPPARPPHATPTPPPHRHPTRHPPLAGRDAERDDR
jgi:hypothetical protein